MVQLVATGFDANGLSAAGLKVLKAALVYASGRREVKEHRLSLDEFCALAGTGLLSGESVRVLLYQAAKAGACIRYIDTDARRGDVVPERISPMLAYASANDSGVAFEFFDFVFEPAVLEKVLTYIAPTRR
jgi:hypothetical protein